MQSYRHKSINYINWSFIERVIVWLGTFGSRTMIFLFMSLLASSESFQEWLPKLETVFLASSIRIVRVSVFQFVQDPDVSKPCFTSAC